MTHETELKLFNEADWAVLAPRLFRYAEFMIFRYGWRTPEDALPKGFQADDLALTAIQKTFEWIKTGEEGKGCRKWNRAKHPDLENHLRSAIDSEANNLVNLLEHRSFNYSAKVDSDSAEKIFTEKVNGGASLELTNLDGEKCAPTDDEVRALLDELYKRFEGDEVAGIVLLSYESQAEKFNVVKPCRVAVEAELAMPDVRNAVKRIRRAAMEIRTKIKSSGGRDEQNEINV